jgi:hypothetical protein
MEDRGHPRVSGQYSGHVIIGFPSMDDDGLAHFGGQTELGLEGTQLLATGGVIIVEVEPGLAYGGHPWVLQHSA